MRASSAQVRHNCTVSETDMTSTIDGLTSPADSEKQRIPLISWRLVTALLALLAMVAILFWVPVPFVVSSPGPTFNVLGSSEGEPMIAIEGTDPTTGDALQLDEPQSASVTDKDKPGQGQLRMVTVSESGGPGNRLNFAQLLVAYADPHSKIVDYDSVYPQGQTETDVSDAQVAMMRNSQMTSQVAALEYLGWDVPATVTIEGAVEGSNAEGVVQQGDILRAITTPDGTRHEVEDGSIPFALMRTVPPGSPMTITVERDGSLQDLSFDSVAPSATESGSKLGIYLTVNPSLPVNISFNLEGVGGPSAGMMFSLGIIDRLTPGDMTGGATIAGTGTMSFDGQVGAIGGIQQKMWGAHDDGAQWFLAPSENCSEVVGHVPGGLNVVSVSTLDEAVAAVETIAQGEGQTLPTCH